MRPGKRQSCRIKTWNPVHYNIKLITKVLAESLNGQVHEILVLVAYLINEGSDNLNIRAVSPEPLQLA